MVGFLLSFKNSGLDPDRKIWQSAHRWREGPVWRYSEEFELGAKGQGFVVDLQLRFNYQVFEVEDCRHCFCSDPGGFFL